MIIESDDGTTINTRRPDGARTYRVLWEIDIQAASSIATVFDVTDQRGRTTRVDLLPDEAD